MERLIVVLLTLVTFCPAQVITGVRHRNVASGGAVTFTRVGSTGSCRVGNGLGCTATIGQTPTVGNLVVCSVSMGGGGVAGTTATVKDSANTSLTQPTGGVIADSGNNSYSFAKYEVVGGVITGAFTSTFSGGNASSMVCGEYHRTSGVWTFDVANSGTNAFTTSGAIATASATTTGTDLLIGIGSVDSAVTTPTWTAGGSWSNFGTTSLATNDYPVGVLADQLTVVSGSYTFNETFAPAGGGIIWSALFISFK